MKATTKINYKKLLLGCFILGLICLALTNTCKRQSLTPSVTIETKPIEERVDKKLDRIKRDSLIIDSLLKQKPKIITRYKTRIDSIYLTAPDTCKDLINELKNECLVIDSLNTNIIAYQIETIINQKSVINDLNSIVKIQKNQLSDSSTVINNLKKEVKKERRKGKIKSVLLSIGATFGGFGLGSLR